MDERRLLSKRTALLLSLGLTALFCLTALLLSLRKPGVVLEKSRVEAANATAEAAELRVEVMPDYFHVDSECIVLGEEEGLKLRVTLPEAGLTADALSLSYDPAMLYIDCGAPETVGGESHFTLCVTARAEGESELIITALCKELSPGENRAELSIRKLDAQAGKLVYITPTGIRYHLSRACAGDGAIKTTLYDALAAGYDPCGSCARNEARALPPSPAAKNS